MDIMSWDEFDEKRARDPTDRAVVNEIRRYAEEHGATVSEFEWTGNDDVPDNENFVVGWDEDFVVFFACTGQEGSIVPPDTLGKLGHLHTVWTARSYHADLSWLGELERLTEIRIVAMPEKEEWFPASWHCASTLQNLYLNYEKDFITYIPESIRELKAMREVELRNEIFFNLSLPDWLGDFPKLERLKLCGSFTSIPYSVVRTWLPFTEDRHAERGIILKDVILMEQDVSMFLNNDRTLIEAYYRGEQAGETEAILECKVIFLGDGGAGKSSLISRIMNNTFQLGEFPTTQGVRVIPWKTELDGKPFLVRFMDFGGQEIMHSMHRCFLSNHTVYVVVCSVRNDTNLNADAVRWLEQVNSYASGCPVILALNKADENPGICVNETALKERYPGLRKVLKTSAAANPGEEFFAGRLDDAIMECASSCAQALRGNKGMLAVKRALENMKEPYITADEYRKICRDNGVKELELQRSLLDWFRNLGVAYSYRQKEQDLRLESLRVLEPVWLTNGIYRLILRTEKEGKNGVLSHEHIREILASPFKGDAREDVVYSPDETDFILHVMRMFKISHKAKEGWELIPMLMQEETPPTAKASKKGALRLRWEGAFLPNNLIHRLMIQKFEELDFRCMWRTGARFKAKSGGCTALAELTDDKSLDVYVTGGSADDRREYMRSFQDKAEEILNDLNLLNATKKYLCCIVNGKEGKILYKTVEFAWEHGDEKILIQDILEYASPEELLQTVDPDPAHWKRRIIRIRNPQTEKESAETWNTNLKNILLAFAIIIILILLAKGADLWELLKLLLGSE